MKGVSKRKKVRQGFIRSVFRFFFLFVFFLTSVSLLLSLSAKFISSEVIFIPSLLALAFPILFMVFIVLMMIVIWRKYYLIFTISLPLLIWSFVVFDRYINFSSFFKKVDCNHSYLIKVMSFNVRLFDLYNWKGYHSNHKAIIDFIINNNPDIACLQEYYYQSDGKYPTTELLKEGIKSMYIHEYFPIVIKNRDFFGIATITKFPIIYKGLLSFEGTSNVCIYTDVLINKDTVRIFNMHLESVRLGIEDYAFISSIEKKLPDSLEITKTRNVLNRLIKAFKKRNMQADLIAEEIKKCPYPIILCGDFNDVPASYTYAQISKKLVDTYRNVDLNLGNTYNGNIPYLRIDYIFHSSHFKTCDFEIHRIDMSDHFPVSATLSFINNK